MTETIQTGCEKETENVHTGHPTPVMYFKIAMTLSFITAVEVGVFYLEFIKYWIIPVLVILSAGKFALVAMFYMHLKYDSKIFSWIFVGGMMLAVSIAIALLALFQHLIKI